MNLPKYKIIKKEDGYTVQFWIGNQGFTLDYKCELKEEAQWMIDTLTKAHKKIALEAVKECIESIPKSYEGEMDDDYERWLIDNGPETLGEAVIDGYEDCLSDVTKILNEFVNQYKK